MRRLTSLLLTLLALVAPLSLVLVSPARAAAPVKGEPRETLRYVVFMQAARAGSMVTRTYDDTHDGKPATRLESETSIQVQVLGSKVEQQITMSHLVDGQGRPVSSRYTVSSGGRAAVIDARYRASEVACTVDAGGQKSTKSVPIPKGVTLVVDPQLASGSGSMLKVGTSSRLHFFEPLTQTIQSVQSTVVRSEPRVVDGKPVEAFVLNTQNSLAGPSVSCVDGKGRLLEENSPLGIRVVLEGLAELPAGAGAATAGYVPPKDFALVTSVKTAIRLPEPRKTTSLSVRIGGIPEASLVLADARQQVSERKESAGGLSAVYAVRSRPLPAKGLAPVPAGATGPGLGDAAYLGVQDPGIRRQAAELAAGADDRAAIARRVRAWVKGHMLKPDNIGTPRSAAEIMKSRDGVCRDYATLFTALARAAGVPARLCSGIVYFQDGFFFHAWAECQLEAGDGGWYAFDPTLDDDFVDATHIKFAQGDPAEMFATVRLVGQIKAEILEYR